MTISWHPDSFPSSFCLQNTNFTQYTKRLSIFWKKNKKWFWQEHLEDDCQNQAKTSCWICLDAEHTYWSALLANAMLLAVCGCFDVRTYGSALGRWSLASPLPSATHMLWPVSPVLQKALYFVLRSCIYVPMLQHSVYCLTVFCILFHQLKQTACGQYSTLQRECLYNCCRNKRWQMAGVGAVGVHTMLKLPDVSLRKTYLGISVILCTHRGETQWLWQYCAMLAI